MNSVIHKSKYLGRSSGKPLIIVGKTVEIEVQYDITKNIKNPLWYIQRQLINNILIKINNVV